MYKKLLCHFPAMTRKALILGAAGRDFHNFNMFFKDNPNYEVVGFTATQIPNISKRQYPAELAGKLYPKGIQIFEETELESLIDKYAIEEVYLSYSDISHKTVMNLACRAQAKGASFVLLGPRETMLKSKKKVISVTAVRTGAGKSPLSRELTKILKAKGIKFVVLRHPMPYGDLVREKVERFATMADLDKYKCTIEEREEYEPHINNGVVVFAGVDYKEILKAAEKEADILIWDGGNNDMPFIKPDLSFVVADALRPGHEVWYYPGETNFRSADAIVINKVSESPNDAKRIRRNAERLNPKATIIEADMTLSTSSKLALKGKRVIIVEDGPTVTHGEMRFGAGFEFANAAGAEIIDPKPHAVGSIKDAYSKFEHLDLVVPALGYYGKQLEDLEKTINNSGADIVISGTPVDLSHILKIKIPIVHVNYEMKERKGSIAAVVDAFLKAE